MSRISFTIPGQLPGFNDYIKAERTNRHIAAKMKRDTQDVARVAIRTIPKSRRRAAPPVEIRYTWYERSRKRDKDNICAFARKCIQDALVAEKVLDGDGWAHVAGFSDRFKVDRERPRVEVEILEVKVASNS